MAMLTLQVEQILSRIKEKLPLVQTYGVKSIGIFGSYIHNQQTDESDIDIGVSFAPGRKTFDNFMEVKFLLEDLFPGKKIDLVIIETIRDEIRSSVIREIRLAS